ncbi:hypothetical protein EXIGLDRAFT_724292 [Exidia glandulosa HHB12029]|uniref:F-box domain-containing protein n=1 Tax=Exidia glandulosa HHB12029 TaxID=1314781 RepID=A0A165MTP6_EXIGL|nr:hypothetical protein EXIGLDRAFT_724292 [Exidia glandulosa HHB12029]
MLSGFGINYGRQQLDQHHPHRLLKLLSTSMSLSTRLPPELWCAIWDDALPLKDRVAVSHVCRYWRDVAVHCASLWEHLEFSSTVHGEDCTCEHCGTWQQSVLAGDGAPCTRVFVRNAGPRPGRTNMPLILSLVPRSGSIPLYLSFDVYPYVTNLSLIEDFGVQLAASGASDRIISISAIFEDPRALRYLMRGIKRFPALESLIAERQFDPSTTTLDSQPWYDTDDIHMPLLEMVTLLGVGWTDAPKVSLPSLRHLGSSFMSPEEVDRVLDACPSLESLRVVALFGPNRPCDYSWRLQSDVMAKLDRVPCVRVDHVWSGSEVWAIDNFGGGSFRPDFSLWYHPEAVPNYGVTFGLGLPDIEVFRIVLHPPTDDDPDSARAALVLDSSSGIRRLLTFSSYNVGAISSRLGEAFANYFGSLKYLALPGACVPDFIRPELVLPELETLVIKDADIDGITQPVNSAVPSLKVLHLMGACDEPRRMTVEVLAAALGCLRPEGARLQELMLDDVELDGDTSVLDTLVETIC